MRFTADRPHSDPEKAARKLVEIANSIEPAQETSRSALISSPPAKRSRGARKH
jgi:hypothetical protein